jgi:hypothetical protein
MLTTGTSATINSFSSPRQIAVWSNTSSQVMYTVPTGKKFVGSLWSNQAANSVGITPAGGSATQIGVPGIGTSYAATSPMQITLVAGTIVTNYSTSAAQYLVGVETDA